MQPYDRKHITAAQLRAARSLLGLSAEALAAQASLGLATVRRAEAADGLGSLTASNAARLIDTLIAAGVEFIDDHGKRRGVRLRD